MDVISYLLGKKAGEGGGGGITPTGTIDITENGTYDVTNYASADVNTPSVDDYFEIHPETMSVNGWLAANYVKKFPELYIPSNVTGLAHLFDNWNYSYTPDLYFGDNVTSMYQMAYNNTHIEEINGIGWNSKLLATLGDTFAGCTALKKVDLSHFTPTVTVSMYTFFNGCTNLKEIDLSGIENVSSMRETFYGCSQLEKLDIRSMLLTNTTNHSGTFSNVPSNCLIIVKDNEQKQWMNINFSSLTNVKTVAEYEAA